MSLPHAPDRPAPPPGAGESDGPEKAEPSVLRTVGIVAAAIFTVATFGLWFYGIFIYDPGLLTDELADDTFPRAAEEVCGATMAQLDALPRAEATEDPVERAGVVDRANGLLTEMVGDLRPLAPTGPELVSEAVNEWIDDWETHLDDRRRYASDLRVDPLARFTEQVKGDKQVSRAIDGYAQVNRMNSCETPGDVG